MWRYSLKSSDIWIGPSALCCGGWTPCLMEYLQLAFSYESFLVSPFVHWIFHQWHFERYIFFSLTQQSCHHNNTTRRRVGAFFVFCLFVFFIVGFWKRLPAEFNTHCVKQSKRLCGSLDLQQTRLAWSLPSLWLFLYAVFCGLSLGAF